MRPIFQVSGSPDLSNGGRVRLLKAALANAFSCRHQIRAHGGRRPRHLVLLLRDALAGAAD